VRPGGRTARTRDAVVAALRQLLAEAEADVTIPAVAQRSGVHATTIYRRWRTIESLMLEVVVDDVREASPIHASGDLRADLTDYVERLLTSLRGPHSLGMLRALMAAAGASDTADEMTDVIQPRIDDFQTMLDAAGVTVIDGLRLIELVIAPAYLWAQLGHPLSAEADTGRLVDTVLRITRPSTLDTPDA